MRKYSKSPYSFDGCHICGECRVAEEEGRSLSAEELMAVFEEQNVKPKQDSKELR